MRPNHSEIAPPETALLRSLAIQLRVVHALFLREVITRYGRHGIGVLWIVAEPMLFTLGVLLFGILQRQMHIQIYQSLHLP